MKILIAFATNSGSTERVAQTIAEELGKAGAQVEVRKIEQATNLETYDAVVVGAPMIMGWHRAATQFLKKNRQGLSQKRVAYFLTAMSLTHTGTTNVDPVPVCVDPGLAKPPKTPGRLSFRENYATVANYVRPILRAASEVQPVSVGIFGGNLEYYRLNIFQMLFVMLIIQAQPSDLRNYSFMREWAAQLRMQLIR